MTINHTERSHAVASPSSASRWLDCTGSLKFASTKINKSTSAAAEGTAAHELVERCLRENVNCDNHYVQSHVQMIRDIKASLKGKYIEFIEHKVDLSLIMGDTRGTLDYALYDESNKMLYVIDFKYGMYKVDADQNEQLLLYAIGMVAELKKQDVVLDNLTLMISQPRIDNVSVYKMSVDELRSWYATVVKPVTDALNRGEYVYKPSDDNCKFCVGNGECAAFVKKFEIPKLTDGEAVSDYDKIVLIQQIEKLSVLADNMRKDLENRLDAGEHISGVRVGTKRGRRVLLPSVYHAAAERGVSITKEQMLPMSDIEKLLGKDVVEKHSRYQEGSKTLIFDGSESVDF